MSICDDIQELQACTDQLKAGQTNMTDILNQILTTIGGTPDGITLQELCDKIDAQTDVLCEKHDTLQEMICDTSDPACLVGEATGTTMVLEGDQTANYTAGLSFDVYNDSGAVVGTATVNSATLDADGNTVVTYGGLTQTSGTLADIKAVKGRLAAPKGEGEEGGKG